MADIELVIKIPKEAYEFAKECKSKGSSKYNWNLTFNNIVFMIANGTPLPKGHGRIIDESEIKHVYYHEEKAEYGAIDFRGIVIDGTDAPTIIEADKTESEEV